MAWDLDHSNAGDVEANEETCPGVHLRKRPWPGLVFSAPWPPGGSEQSRPEQVTVCLSFFSSLFSMKTRPSTSHYPLHQSQTVS